MDGKRSMPAAWLPRRRPQADPTTLYARAQVARAVAREVQGESRRILARCLEERISREGDRLV
jgi:hypothetical protein